MTKASILCREHFTDKEKPVCTETPSSDIKP
jgi:hypothetical protein